MDLAHKTMKQNGQLVMCLRDVMKANSRHVDSHSWHEMFHNCDVSRAAVAIQRPPGGYSLRTRRIYRTHHAKERWLHIINTCQDTIFNWVQPNIDDETKGPWQRLATGPCTLRSNTELFMPDYFFLRKLYIPQPISSLGFMWKYWNNTSSAKFTSISQGSSWRQTDYWWNYVRREQKLGTADSIKRGINISSRKCFICTVTTDRIIQRHKVRCTVTGWHNVFSRAPETS
jgi:hypothetical protein